MEKAILAIVNPVSAGGKTADRWPEYEKVFRENGIELDVKYTEEPFHASRLAREALEQGYQKIMSVGGDGTANEIINGIVEKSKVIKPGVELILFSQGTGCDLIKSLGIKKHVEEIIKMIYYGKTRYIDLGRLTYISADGEECERYFLNLSDVGIGAETADRVNRGEKRFGGFLTFLKAVLWTIVRYKNKGLKISVDGKEFMNDSINSVMVANGCYFGGGIKIAPNALMNDGLFNIIVMGDLSKIEILLNLGRAYKGTHIYHPKIHRLQGKKITIKSINSIEKKLLVEVDGEITGQLPVTMEIFKKRVPLLIL